MLFRLVLILPRRTATERPISGADCSLAPAREQDRGPLLWDSDLAWQRIRDNDVDLTASKLMTGANELVRLADHLLRYLQNDEISVTVVLCKSTFDSYWIGRHRRFRIARVTKSWWRRRKRCSFSGGRPQSPRLPAGSSAAARSQYGRSLISTCGMRIM